MQSTPDPSKKKIVSGVDHPEALLLELEDAELPDLLCSWIWRDNTKLGCVETVRVIGVDQPEEAPRTGPCRTLGRKPGADKTFW